MTRTVLALLATAVLSAAGPVTAFAADMPVKAPLRPVVVPFTWTGVYLGGHVGYSWSGGSSHYDNPLLAGVDISMKPAGVAGGVQGGFNYQLPNNVVLGVEADISWADVSDSIPDRLAALNGRPGNTITSLTDLAGTARGRIGYAFGQVLPYVTGGYAWAHSKISATDGPLSATANYSGWTIGGGIEYAFNRTISAKAEYLHVQFDSHQFFGGAVYSSTAKPNSDSVRIGINFRP